MTSSQAQRAPIADLKQKLCMNLSTSLAVCDLHVPPPPCPLPQTLPNAALAHLTPVVNPATPAPIIKTLGASPAALLCKAGPLVLKLRRIVSSKAGAQLLEPLLAC